MERGTRMSFKKIIAEFVAKIVFVMAKKACGAVSMFCIHQTNEPVQVSEFFNEQ